jgi:hypothetical protein
MRRGFVALLVLLSFLLVPAAGAITIPPTQESTSTSHMAGSVRKIVVDSNSGDVTVKPGSGTTIKHTDHWFYDKPTVKVSLSDGVLTVSSRCSNAPLNNCWTEVTASVARTAVVQAASDNGFIHVSGMRTTSVSGLTNNGDVLVSNVQSHLVKATTSNGDVKVNLSSAPDDTLLRTDNGNVTALVPRGRYVLDLRVSSGDVQVSGVRNSRNSPHKLSARTTNGDITISGR